MDHYKMLAEHRRHHCNVKRLMKNIVCQRALKSRMVKKVPSTSIMRYGKIDCNYFKNFGMMVWRNIWKRVLNTSKWSLVVWQMREKNWEGSKSSSEKNRDYSYSNIETPYAGHGSIFHIFVQDKLFCKQLLNLKVELWFVKFLSEKKKHR